MISRTLFSVCYVFFLLSISQSADYYRAHYCQNTTYDSNVNREYRANLDTLLSSLTSNASSANGFYNSTSGLGTSNTVYGLFLCQGDLSNDDCEQCVVPASKKILELCSDQKTAIVWFSNCWLRYSNESIFSRRDDRVVEYWSNSWNMTSEPERFKKLVDKMLDETTNQAANDRSGKKFATQQVQFSPFQKAFALGQCTPDLSSTDCNICLRNAIQYIPICCTGKRGGRVLFPSCTIRFESFPFFKVDISTLGPVPPALPPPLRPASKEKGSISGVAVPILVPLGACLLLFFLGILCIIRRSQKRCNLKSESTDGSEISRVESLQYKLSEIQAATNNFSIDHKIGEGGFGHVYKGRLPNGKEIAVKRLSRSSAQGADEFKNEIVLVVKLQHRNLVRLLGFCLEEEEKILVYEFVPNMSLDGFLFDPEKRTILDWSIRHKIVEGIARGLLYLHEDSRLRVVHRDLKASNVLLDIGLNPKIADFGTARVFGINQSKENTRRIAGTRGYMAPEYAMHGQFSVKSDVYSFGVLLLEIVSGKKSTHRYQSDGAEDLLGSDDAEDLVSYAWRNWREESPLALLDPIMGNSYNSIEAIRCIHVALLCTEANVERRLTMASVVLVLNNNSVILPAPQQPGFFTRNKTNNCPVQLESRTSAKRLMPLSVDNKSITKLYPR